MNQKSKSLLTGISIAIVYLVVNYFIIPILPSSCHVAVDLIAETVLYLPALFFLIRPFCTIKSMRLLNILFVITLLLSVFIFADNITPFTVIVSVLSATGSYLFILALDSLKK